MQCRQLGVRAQIVEARNVREVVEALRGLRGLCCTLEGRQDAWLLIYHSDLEEVVPTR